MSNKLKILAGLAGLGLVGYAFLHTGIARRVFFEVFAYVKGVDVLGPTTVRELPNDSPYEQWLVAARKEMPIFEGLVIDDVAAVPLRPWPQMGEGVVGLYLRFADYQMTDGRILEIPAGRHTTNQRHLYEQDIYMISGNGYSTLQQEGKPQQRVEWKRGDVLSIPLNSRYQHFSAGDENARMLIVTSFPLLLNVMANEAFIANNSFEFTDRYDGSKDYFERVEGRDELSATANFIRDVQQTKMVPFDFRGAGSETFGWEMAANSMLSLHVSKMPPNMYKKAHRHSSDAFILLLSGTGFSVTWPEGEYNKRVRVDWKPGTLFVPPTYWYHQHLNTGTTPASYLAINTTSFVKNIGLRFSDQLEVDIQEVKDEWNMEVEKLSREQR